MLFPTVTFFIFFIFILILNWKLKSRPLLWRIFLISTSYFFYATWNWRFVVLLAIISIFNFYSGLILGKPERESKASLNLKAGVFWCRGNQKIFLAISVGINILALAVLKYFDFFQVSFGTLLGKLGFGTNPLLLNIVLPIGLSFYVLRVISYNIDIFRRKINPEKSLLDFSIYVAFFPQLLAGPIVRPGEFLPQLKNGGAKTIENLEENFGLILGGLFKKIVIASYLTVNIVDDVFAVPQNHSQFSVMLAIYAYAIVIYCDFSGYSDMAIGFSGLLGFKSPINFNSPYLAKDFQDFWRRWHMTFSGWLRDYVYIPLGGNKKGKIMTYFNLMATMIVSGLWHGTGLHFVFWGIGHGFGSINSHLKKDILKGKTLSRINRIFSWFITFNSICFLWILFRAENIQSAISVIKQFFNWKSSVEPIQVYTILVIALSFIIFALENKIRNLFVSLEKRLPLAFQILSIAIFIIILIKLGPDIISPFIYFKF